jgi:hypothetical protein
MRPLRRSMTIALLCAVVLAMTVAPASVAASPSPSGGQAPSTLRAWDQAWQPVSRLLGWLASFWSVAGRPGPQDRPNNGPGIDPNGGAAPRAGARPGPPDRPNNGLGIDPNGGAAPRAGVRPPGGG